MSIMARRNVMRMVKARENSCEIQEGPSLDKLYETFMVEGLLHVVDMENNVLLPVQMCEY